MIMPDISDIQVYDVWLMWVEFADHPEVGKVRPVIITHVDQHALQGIAVKVTSNITWNEPGDVLLVDWEQEGLYKPSLARCSQSFEFQVQDLYEKFGVLSDTDIRRLTQALRSIGL